MDQAVSEECFSLTLIFAEFSQIYLYVYTFDINTKFAHVEIHKWI